MLIPLERFIYPTQSELFEILGKMYEGNALVSTGAFILVEGESLIMLVAHLDTVHKMPVKEICETADGNILMSPQGIGGDDRCGVYALVNCYKMALKKPWLLFTCDEEIGGIGAQAFADAYLNGELPEKLCDLKIIIEVDRRGQNDAVYYDCYNPDFENYIASKGFEMQYGSFSDISIIAPALGVAAVNLSSGYYNAHTQHEYINRKQINATIQKVNEILQEAEESNFPKFEYVDRFSSYGYSSNSSIKLPKDLPDKYAPLYEDLLEWYSVEELERGRRALGNEFIEELYAYEFGAGYVFDELHEGIFDND